jgi:hypothetical protein
MSPATLVAVPSTLPGGETPRGPDPSCPSEAYWDGLACAHATATCGGWDGVSCDPSSASPPDRERAVEREFARIESEAPTVCNEDDESRQVYSGNMTDIIRATDMALGQVEQLRLALQRVPQQTPRSEVAAHARIGSLYDCIWTSLRQAIPTFLTPQQQAALTKLNAILTQLNNQAQVDDTLAQIRARWREAKDKYLDILETKMVRHYVTAALLARRYAIDGFSFTRAHPRLPIVASILGDEKMARLLGDMIDPTDPEPDPTKRRRVVHTPGAFGVGP